jgi:hypothetical protein
MEDYSGLEIFGPNFEISQGLGKCLAFSRQRSLQLIFAPEILLKTVLMVQTSKFCPIAKQPPKPIQDSKIVEECRNSLQEFALHKNLTLMWVSHKTMGKRETLVLLDKSHKASTSEKTDKSLCK